MGDGSPDRLHVLRTATLISVLVGAAASIALTLVAGRHNSSVLLQVLFTLWVTSPFAGAVWALRISTRWDSVTQEMIAGAILVLALGSVAIYGYVVLARPGAKLGFIFLVVPLASWLDVGILSPILAVVSARRARGRRRP